MFPLIHSLRYAPFGMREIKDMPQAERAKAEQELLKYCELDTYPMVKVYEKLKRGS